jgi:hypothetical protein
MKNSIYIFLAVFVMSLGIYSCDSSLGYDPNVQITKINKDTTSNSPDSSNKEVIFNLDSIRFDGFKETVFIKQDHEPQPPKRILLDWNYYVVSKNIRIDTSDTDTKLWIDLDLINKDPDNAPKYKDIIDRVVSFNLSFAAVLNTQIFKLDDPSKNTRWFELSVKGLQQNNNGTFNGSQIPSQMVILENNREIGYIKILLESIPLENLHNNIKIEKFSGFIWLYYKKK